MAMHGDISGLRVVYEKERLADLFHKNNVRTGMCAQAVCFKISMWQFPGTGFDCRNRQIKSFHGLKNGVCTSHHI
jgi:hypothetical protein